MGSGVIFRSSVSSCRLMVPCAAEVGVVGVDHEHLARHQAVLDVERRRRRSAARPVLSPPTQNLTISAMSAPANSSRRLLTSPPPDTQVDAAVGGAEHRGGGVARALQLRPAVDRAERFLEQLGAGHELADVQLPEARCRCRPRASAARALTVDAACSWSRRPRRNRRASNLNTPSSRSSFALRLSSGSLSRLRNFVAVSVTCASTRRSFSRLIGLAGSTLPGACGCRARPAPRRRSRRGPRCRAASNAACRRASGASCAMSDAEFAAEVALADRAAEIAEAPDIALAVRAARSACRARYREARSAARRRAWRGCLPAMRKPRVDPAQRATSPVIVPSKDEPGLADRRAQLQRIGRCD